MSVLHKRNEKDLGLFFKHIHRRIVLDRHSPSEQRYFYFCSKQNNLFFIATIDTEPVLF